MQGWVSTGTLNVIMLMSNCLHGHNRLGEGCSHAAAILFKIECAVRNGYTAATSSQCSWNQVFSTKESFVLMQCSSYPVDIVFFV